MYVYNCNVSHAEHIIDYYILFVRTLALIGSIMVMLSMCEYIGWKHSSIQ